MNAQPIRLAFATDVSCAHVLTVTALLRLDAASWVVDGGSGCDVVVRAANDAAGDFPGVVALRLGNADGSLREVSELRARIAGIARARQAERSAEVAASATPMVLGNARELAARLRRATAGERLFLCDDHGRGAWLDTTSHTAGIEPAISAGFGEWAATSLQVRAYTGGATEESGGPSVPLDEFLWNFALARRWSLETLGLGVNDRIQLTRWPDFGRLERRRSFMRLTSHLSRKAVAVGELFELQLAPDNDVLALLAAVDLNGWLAIEAGSTVLAPTIVAATPERVGMFSALRSLRRILGMDSAT